VRTEAQRAKSRAYYQANREKLIEYGKAYYRQNKEKVLTYTGPAYIRPCGNARRLRVRRASGASALK
jgi:hypothetical protein